VAAARWVGAARIPAVILLFAAGFVLTGWLELRDMVDESVLQGVDGDEAVGVLSQTDIVIARHGHALTEARAFKVGDWMTEGCASVDIDSPMHQAVNRMLRQRIHRLVVTDNGKPVGVVSMTDIVRKAMAAD